MLTPLSNKENNSKTSTDYYYAQQQSQHYYCPTSIDSSSNNLQNYRTSIYDANQYYTLSSGYSHSHIPNHIPEEDSSTIYIPTYPHQNYPPDDGHVNEVFYSQKSSNPQIAPLYDYNLPAIPLHSSNGIFPPHSNYIPSSVEQTNCNTNNVDYLTSYVS